MQRRWFLVPQRKDLSRFLHQFLTPASAGSAGCGVRSKARLAERKPDELRSPERALGERSGALGSPSRAYGSAQQSERVRRIGVLAPA